MLRVLIADDEPLARTRMRRLLGEESDIEIVAECENGAEAVEQIHALRPDVAFLDIEMPELDGFEVVAGVAGAPTAIVFVTAHDEHAIRAFDEEALDYVLKPVETERLRRTLARVRSRVPSQPAPLRRLITRTRGRVVLINVADVLYIEAAGNYVRVHTAAGHHLIRQKLTELESHLDRAAFVRIHRSTIVRVDAVTELRPWFGGDAIVVLRNGQELTLSRTWRERAAAVLGIG